MKITMIKLFLFCSSTLMIANSNLTASAFTMAEARETYSKTDTLELAGYDNNELGVKMTFSFKATQLYQVEIKDVTMADNAKPGAVFPKGTVVSIDARNIRNSLSAIYYQLDDAPEQTYFGVLRLVAKGEHRIRIRAIDSLGNEFFSGPIKFRIVE